MHEAWEKQGPFLYLSSPYLSSPFCMQCGSHPKAERVQLSCGSACVASCDHNYRCEAAELDVRVMQ